jgi:cell wall-associated NlpC family hydrolase
LRLRGLTLTLAAVLVAIPCASATGQSPTSGGGVSSTAPLVPTDPIAPPAPDPGGGAQYGQPAVAQQTVPGTVAKILPNGLAAAPALAPPAVQQAIWATNAIIGKPYILGGGHNLTFSGRGYDCSGTVSYALHGGGLLSKPNDSSAFMRWGVTGIGTWMTVWTNPGHAYLIIAGIRLDTSKSGDPRGKDGPRWRPVLRSSRGFHARHPLGY